MLISGYNHIDIESLFPRGVDIHHSLRVVRIGSKEEFQCCEREGVHSAVQQVGPLTDKELIDPAQFRVVVADESHNMKTMDAKRTTVCLPF